MSNLKDLWSIMADEREVILSGRLGALPSLLARKESCLSALMNGPHPSSLDLAAIRHDLFANQALLESAAKGVRAALTRIAEIRAVGNGLCAYNARGENVHHEQAAPVLERRA